MRKNLIIILLSICTLSVLTLLVIELTGISRYSMLGKRKDIGVVYSKDGTVYHGEISPEQTKTREQIVQKMPKTTMQFYETRHNFGPVTQGTTVTHVFKFKNTGQNNLMISKTDVTCGCTVPNFPLDPIPPGQDGELTVVFNTTAKRDYQQKNITVHANTLPESVTISVEALVNEAK